MAAAEAPDSSMDDQQQPFRAVHGLNKDQVERYSRHLLLPSFGIAGQGQLCRSKVLIVGCGGLGSPAALYLAAAGVGTLGLVDHDVVELSNMHRQVIHTESRLGQHKATSAAAAVTAINSSVAVNTYLEGLNPNNAVDIISRYDVVIDASDNPPTRYLINDACVACDVPLVSAAAVGTDGQLTVYNYGADGPCYRCLFPECPAAANCSRCADAGVLGPVPGVMGVLQALEAIKVLSGCGQVHAGRLMLFDALAGRFSSIKLRGKAAACVACGTTPQITRDSVARYNYTAFTGGQQATDGPPVPLRVLPQEQRITPGQLQQLLAERKAAPPATAAPSPAAAEAAEPSSAAAAQAQPEQQGGVQPSSSSSPSSSTPSLLLLDVRPPEQFAIMSLPGSVNVPFLQFEQRLPEVLGMCGEKQPAGQHLTQQEEAGPSAGAQQATPVAGSSGVDTSASSKPSRQASQRIVVMCRRGNHSQLAVQQLNQAGVVDVVDVEGGYEAWAAQVDARMPVL